MSQAKPDMTANSYPRMTAAVVSLARSLAAFSLAVMLLIFVCQAAHAADPARNFRLPQLDGPGELSLEDFRGKVVYLDFWASWCGPCRKSLPLYESIYQEMGTPNGGGQNGEMPFTVVAINLDEETGDAVRFLQQHSVSYPVLLDPAGVAAAEWQVKVMPSSFLLDRSGVVVKEYAGFEESHIEEIRHDIQAQLEIQDPH